MLKVFICASSSCEVKFAPMSVSTAIVGVIIISGGLSFFLRSVRMTVQKTQMDSEVDHFIT